MFCEKRVKIMVSFFFFFWLCHVRAWLTLTISPPLDCFGIYRCMLRDTSTRACHICVVPVHATGHRLSVSRDTYMEDAKEGVSMRGRHVC